MRVTLSTARARLGAVLARSSTVPWADRFHAFASKVSSVLGAPAAFLVALSVVFVWMVTGPLFHYSDTWQLAINTGTTIVTFLMVFLIQNTQNRDAKALHLKLDELIRANRHARNALIDLQELTDSELQALELEFRKLRGAPVPEKKPHQAPPSAS
jgi:low affinity Fe/Cu permease